MKKLVILVVGMICLSGCAEVENNITIPQKIITTRCCLDTFDSIVVDGNTRVELVNGEDKITVSGIKTAKYNCQNRVINRVLYINNGNDDQSIDVDTKVKVSASRLKNITVTDNAVINAKDLRANNLIITAKKYGTINFQGKFGVNKIFQYGNGRINIDWVDSDLLYIESYGDGPIYLGGRACDLSVKLMKNANLHARYLRTKKASIFAVDSAIAEVLVLDTLKAFAVDRSNIFYYKRPKTITVVTKNHGNVLHAGWIQ
jgi:membrane-bound inhibitor of C-type lysozyme